MNKQMSLLNTSYNTTTKQSKTQINQKNNNTKKPQKTQTSMYLMSSVDEAYIIVKQLSSTNV